MITDNAPQTFRAIRKFSERKKIVYCSGTFDLFHVGHLSFLQDCRKLGDVLVVGVGCDANIKSGKKDSRPIINEIARLAIVDALKIVDICFLDSFVPNATEHPLTFLGIVLQNLCPDIYAINADASFIEYRKNLCATRGINLIVMERASPPGFEGISTSAIIEKIKSS